MFIPCCRTKTHDALPGVARRQAAVAEGVQLIEFRMNRGAAIPWHDHVNEQVGMVVSGSIVLTIGKDAMTLGPGDAYVIPSGVAHTVEVLEDSVVLDVFSPPRDDYRDLVP